MKTVPSPPGPLCCTVCGRPLAAGEGIAECYEGERRVFCSAKCQAQFECEPERYAPETKCLSCPPGYS
jgi:YHS domain-containing protein